MTLPPFAGYLDLARFLGLSPDRAAAELDVDAGMQALAGASAKIREVCRWSVTEESTGDVVDWPCTGTLFLPTLRLTALSVSVDGQPWVDRQDFTWTRTGRVTLLSRAGSRSLVSVSYTHGWPDPPDVLRDVCCEQAAASLSNPRRLVSVTTGPFTEQFQRDPGPADLSGDLRVQAFVVPVVG